MRNGLAPSSSSQSAISSNTAAISTLVTPMSASSALARWPHPSAGRPAWLHRFGGADLRGADDDARLVVHRHEATAAIVCAERDRGVDQIGRASCRERV